MDAKSPRATTSVVGFDSRILLQTIGKDTKQTNDSGVAGIVSPQETILLLAHRGGIILLDKLEFDEVIKVLVLCSNGLSSKMLLAHLSSKMVGCRTAALVVTADNEYKENNYHIPRCVSELQALNLDVDILDLDKHSADLLLKYDVVEFIGGNPYYLLHTIRKNNSAEVLRNIATTKILIGWSAAAFVFGPTLELVNCYSSEMNFLGLTDLSGLSLTDVQVLPHYSKFLSRFEQFEEKCCAYEKEHGVNVIRISDGDGVLIDGEVHICKA